MDKSTILIVDDDPALLQALPLVLNLRLDGIEVHTTDSALEALKLIQEHQLRTRVFEQQLALKLHAKALERMVQKRTQELIEANAAKDKLLKIISHELKTPLTSLKGMTQLLHRQSTKADSAEVVSMG